jgi:hypothetical protein
MGHNSRLTMAAYRKQPAVNHNWRYGPGFVWYWRPLQIKLYHPLMISVILKYYHKYATILFVDAKCRFIQLLYWVKYQLLHNQNRHCPVGEIVRKKSGLLLIIKRYESQISHLFYFMKNDSAIL